MGAVYAPHRGPYDSTFVKPTGRGRETGDHQLVPWSNLPIILDTRWGRVLSERRSFQFDRFSRLLLFFSEQCEGPSVAGSPVPEGTAGDATLDVGVGLRVLELELGPSPLSSPDDVTNLAIGPPGKTY